MHSRKIKEVRVRFKRYAFLLGVFAWKPSAQAETTVRGIATIGYARALNKDGSGYTGIPRNGTLSRDSKLGLNIAGTFENPQISFAAQLLARSNNTFGAGNQNYDLGADWFFITLRPIEEVGLRMGRQSLPYSMIAEEQDVGLVYPWVRQPIELGFNLKSINGAQLRFEKSQGDLGFEAGSYAGKERIKGGYIFESTKDFSKVPPANSPVATEVDSEANFENVFGGFISLTYDKAMVRGSYTQMKTTTSSTSFSPLVLVNPSNPATPIVSTSEVL
jgi:hypothetical protein